MSDYFRLLFARPSALEGIARILDFGNTLSEYNVSSNSSRTDFLALRADWRAVANDLGVAWSHEANAHPKSEQENA